MSVQQVPPEVTLDSGTVGAEVALVGPLPRVGAHVLVHVRPAGNPLAANLTVDACHFFGGGLCLGG